LLACDDTDALPSNKTKFSLFFKFFLLHFPEQGTYLLETEKELPAVKHSPVQRVDPSTKIKLQLFPVDEVTCLGLQKVT